VLVFYDINFSINYVNRSLKQIIAREKIMGDDLDLMDGAVIEFRQNPIITSEYALVTTAASKKPKVKIEPVPYDDRSYDEKCPLCVGNEGMTPPEKYRIDGMDGEWALRVVNNRFPVLNENGNM